MEIIGKQIECGFSVENTRGTAPAQANAWVKNITANVLEKADHAIDEASRGVFEDSDGRRVVKKWIEGDIELPLYANSFGYLLYNLYGSVSSDKKAEGVYEHKFNVRQETLDPSLTIYLKDGGVRQLAYQNSHINTLSIAGAVDDYIKVSASYIGKDAVANNDTPSYEKDIDFIGKEMTIKIADTKNGLSQATPLCLKDFSIEYDKGLIADHCLGSYSPSEIHKTKMAIQGSFTKNLEDEVFKNLYSNNDTKVMEIKIEGENDIATGHAPALVITLYKTQVINWDRSGGKDDVVIESIDFKAFYNSDEQKQSEVVLKNKQDEYEVEISA